MKYSPVSIILKWFTVIVLFSIIAVLFIPVEANYTFIDLFRYTSGNIANSVVITFLIPFIIVFVSSIIMMFKISIPVSVIVACLNAIATFWFTGYKLSTLYSTTPIVTFGLVISILGIILPVLTIIIAKTTAKKAD